MSDLVDFVIARFAEDPRRIAPDGPGVREASPYTLRRTALRYADHPDYRQEWRPEPEQAGEGRAAMTTPVASEGLALLREIAVTAHEEVRRYWVRYAEEWEALVLVGPRLWQLLAATVAREGEPLWHLDRVANQVIGLDGMTRIVRADIGLDEWRVALLTDRRGSVPSS